jgi:hypothetical protein
LAGKKNKVKPDLIYHIVQQCMRLYRAEIAADEAKQREESARTARSLHFLYDPMICRNTPFE